MTGFFNRFDRNRGKEAAAAATVAASPSTPPATVTAAREAAQHGDRHRDRGDPAGAAEWYAKALAVLPERNDLRVQLANMLKDSGRLADAEVQYRAALAAEPANADIALQLGRALKMAGRLAEAVTMFERAMDLVPGPGDAATELLHLGRLDAAHPLYRRDAHIDRSTGLLAATVELTRLRRDIDRALARLPDLATWSALPIEHYGLLRELQDLPVVPLGEEVEDLVVGPTLCHLVRDAPNATRPAH